VGPNEASLYFIEQPENLQERLTARLGSIRSLLSSSYCAGVVDQFVLTVAADSKINSRFATTNFRKLKGHLVDQVCMAIGGPWT